MKDLKKPLTTYIDHELGVKEVIELDAYHELRDQLATAVATLNRIALMGSSSEAYTSHFTNYTNGLVRNVLHNIETQSRFEKV